MFKISKAVVNVLKYYFPSSNLSAAISDQERESGQSFLNPENEITQEINIGSKGLVIKFAAKKTGWNEEQTADFGVPVKQVHFGSQFTAIYNMVGDTLEEKQNGLFSANVTRKVINDEMVMEVTAGEAHCKRYYRRI